MISTDAMRYGIRELDSGISDSMTTDNAYYVTPLYLKSSAMRQSIVFEGCSLCEHLKANLR